MKKINTWAIPIVNTWDHCKNGLGKNFNIEDKRTKKLMKMHKALQPSDDYTNQEKKEE